MHYHRNTVAMRANGATSPSADYENVRSGRGLQMNLCEDRYRESRALRPEYRTVVRLVFV